MSLYLSGACNPNADALAILRRELTLDARDALAHLLNNALCAVAMEASFATIDRDCLASAILHLKETVEAILESQGDN